MRGVRRAAVAVGVMLAATGGPGPSQGQAQPVVAWEDNGKGKTDIPVPPSDVLYPPTGGAGAQKVLRDLGPDKTLAVCAFGLTGADAAKNAAKNWGRAFGGLLGWAIAGAVVSSREDSAYAQELSQDFRSVYEQALAGTGAFQLSPSAQLVGAGDGTAPSLVQAARQNGLFACVRAQSAVSATFGFRKSVKVTTSWLLVGPSGWETEIRTNAVSEGSLGLGPDTADPALRSLFLRLARISVWQFLEKLNGLLKKAGSATEIAIVDPEEVSVDTLIDPGTFAQPEPECTLNADGKWEKHVTLPNGVDVALVYIPDGTYLMGSEAWVDDESSQPQDQVTISRAFWLGKYELTQAQWKAVLQTNPSKSKGDTLPVDSVSWNDTRKFLTALNEYLGLGGEQAFRLPTEAEWEYAARAGTTANFSFSNSTKDLGSYAWFDKNAKGTAHPVGELRPNPWGVYDIYGNVAEWCEDGWHDDYEGGPVDGTAWRAEDSDRVYRGGNWRQSGTELRSYCRYSEDADSGDKAIGFRLAVPALHPKSERPTVADPASIVPEDAAAGTAVDPGTLPQPEPDCTLNPDGRWEKHLTLPNGVDLALVYIPGGGFVMGSDQWVDDESSQPQHPVTISRAFWLGKHELTQAQWKAVLQTNPSESKGDTLPVESVSWDDTKKFLAAINQHLALSGENALRLPTEAEWEYAARAGTEGNYSFSDTSRTLGQYAWYDRNSSGATHPVGQLRPNPWGVYDIYGNVAEWCEDSWHDDYKGAPIDGTAWQSEDSDRVFRGGNWDQSATELRSYCRGTEDADSGDETLGFRLVMPALPPQSALPSMGSALSSLPNKR
jgi:formylglycine-generating enzyme required for sulfatase activity